jgi:O-acetyl-ADP-ribose deacetylase (regulator of RNase III)
MPLVKRSEPDLLRFSAFTDVLVNPVNLYGTMGAGLAKAFADQFPAMYEAYKAMCRDEHGERGKGQLQIGKLHIYYNEDTKNIIVNLPTKRHFADSSDLNDVEIGCEKLAEYLKKHPFYTVAMPILGAGLGKLDVDYVYPVIAKHLDSLPNIIHLCMRPDRFERPPRYLAIIGSREYWDYDRIDLGVADGLIEFGLAYEDFDAAISGGARGVDRVGCGTGTPDDVQPNIAKTHGLRPIVCLADWDRYRKSAGYLRNRTIADIGTHFIAFVGKRSVGTRATIALVTKHNELVDQLEKARQYPTGGDVFTTTYHHPIPEKKQIFIHDISAVSL